MLPAAAKRNLSSERLEPDSHSFLIPLTGRLSCRHPSLPIPTTHEAGSTALPVQPESRDFYTKTLLRAGLPSPFISVQRPCTVNTGWKKSSARILGWFLPAFAKADPCVFAVTCAQSCRICLHLKIVTYLIALDRPSNFVKRSSNNTCGI